MTLSPELSVSTEMLRLSVTPCVQTPAVCFEIFVFSTLTDHRKVKQVNYPKYSSTRSNFEKCRTPTGGYGGLLSMTFHCRGDAIAFFDNLDTVKGPSLGTNFTLRYCQYNRLLLAPSNICQFTLRNTCALRGVGMGMDVSTDYNSWLELTLTVCILGCGS